MTAAGCLVILLAGRYTPAELPGAVSRGEPSAVVMTEPSLEINKEMTGDAAAEPDLFCDNSGQSRHLTTRTAQAVRAFFDKTSLILAEYKNGGGESSHEPSVLNYNLMMLAPEDSEPFAIPAEGITVQNLRTSLEAVYKQFARQYDLPYRTKAQDTYGGQIFETLSRKDAEWTSSLYRWIQADPQQAAIRQGLPVSAVEGGYDPTNPRHDKEDPSTWLIPSWKNVTIRIYDGDGKTTELYSNAQAIASMASVYTYYTGWEDVEGFKAYADRLWDASHSYSVSIGDVYYCEGCVDPTAPSPENAVLAEEAALEEAAEILSVDAANTQETAAGASEGEAAAGPGQAAPSVAETEGAAGTGIGTGEALQPTAGAAGTGAGTPQETQPAAIPQAETLPAKVLPETAAQTQPMQPADPAGDYLASGESLASGNGLTSGDGIAAGGTLLPGGTLNSGTGETAAQTASAGPSGPSADLAGAGNGSVGGMGSTDGVGSAGNTDGGGAAGMTGTDSTGAAGMFGADNTGAAGMTGADNKGVADLAGADGTAAPLTGSTEGTLDAAAHPVKSAELHLNEEGKFCPGHVDLTITAKINGITERNNLFTLAAAEGGRKTESAQAWPGWNNYTKAYARKLYQQDWAGRYGLTLTELALGKPLTALEISAYMNALPVGTSNERRAVIAYALNSVGKIPYYYGGKSKAPGYERNQFCVLTSPDRKGRILSGLDCSGWVNWVYWSVTGKAPTVYGTSGLARVGRPVSRENLQPGDIIVRLGADSHVMMFLGWTADHSMICIHETGGATSNVTVSITNVNWPYYRSLFAD